MNHKSVVQRFLTAALAVTLALVAFSTTRVQAADKVTLTLESWRTGDDEVWDTIIKDFNKNNPDIEVKFSPTKPDEYNGALGAKLKSGTAGDLITCRPFSLSLGMFQGGQLADLSTLPGMEHFSDFARHAWSTPDGKTTFCVPMASVLHGFIYNKDYFDKNGFTEPKTYEEFLTLLGKIQKEGSMAPLALGTKEGWTTTSMGLDNIGPNFWGGEAGNDGLLSGTRKYNDKGFAAAFDALSKWSPYLPKGNEAIAYTDSQQLFTSGKAAIFPAGSWEISGFEKAVDFKMGAFKAPPPAGASQCYISDEIDIALGANAASPHLDAAKKFLAYVAGADFGKLYAQGLPGFFPLGDYKIELTDPLANTFLSWRSQCASTLRSSYQLPANPNLDTETELWTVTSLLLQGKLTPQAAADRIQKDLDSWYKPSAAPAMAATMAATAAK